MRLKDKVALITGGGRGIGATTALLFAQEGAIVGLIDLREEGLKEIAARASEQGFKFEIFWADVTKKDQIHRVFDSFVGAHGRLDILVNNAGVSVSKPMLEKTVEDWMKILEVNLVSVYLCSQVAAKYMLEKKSGKIINIASIRGIDHCGREGVIDYSAAKAGVINLTKTLAKGLAPYINVNAVAPGHTNTEMIQKLPEEVRRNMIEGSYLKRLAEPIDIARAILFLASGDADFITGQVLLVDGGFSLKAG